MSPQEPPSPPFAEGLAAAWRAATAFWGLGSGFAAGGGLIADPRVAQRLWWRWLEGAAQPMRRDFALDSVVGPRGPERLAWTRRALSPFVTLACVDRAARPPCERSERARVLLAPPLAGGFAFVLRDMAARLAVDRPLGVIEWSNARHVPTRAGGFDLDDQIDAIGAAAAACGPEPAHWVAVCQAGPPMLIAAALAAAEGRGPRSLTLIGAPIDPAAAPSPVSATLLSRDLTHYAEQCVARDVGDGLRRVHPAEAQLALVIATLAAQSPARHEMARLVAAEESADPSRLTFLEAVTSLADIPAEHFLSALERVYLAPEGPCAGFRLRARRADPAALGRMPVLVVEGAIDRVSAPGQGAAALTLCPAAGDAPRWRLVAADTGHFGLFWGHAWRRRVAPALEASMAAAEARAGVGKPPGRTP